MLTVVESLSTGSHERGMLPNTQGTLDEATPDRLRSLPGDRNDEARAAP